jgi:RNA 3'-terminal phosphate cyclase
MTQDNQALSFNNLGAAHNQGLRVALALSLAHGRDITFQGLKDDTPHPRSGLGAASLNLLASLARLSQGAFTGVAGEEGGAFTPGRLRGGQYNISLSALRFSEAPLSWLLEAAALSCLHLEEDFCLLASGGGTHVFGGPTTEEVVHLILPLWARAGLTASYSEIAPGFHPNASGEAEIIIAPGRNLAPLELTGSFTPQTLGIEAVSAGLPPYLMENALEAVEERLLRHGLPAPLTRLRRPLAGHGQSLLLWADNGQWRVGFSVTGRKGAPLSVLAVQTVEDMRDFLRSGASLPARQALWCIPLLSLAGGISRIAVDRDEQSLRAAVQVLNRFRPGSALLLPWQGSFLLQVQGPG